VPDPPEIAVGAVARRADAILLVRRANPPGRGRWSVPGGRVRPGERLSEALEREVEEETGLRCRTGPFLGLVERLGEEPVPHHFVILDYRVEILGPTTPTAGSDATDAAWVPIAELADWDLVDGLLDFLDGVDALG
jgi:ADP-ribose pyrophosphatase YjhB (NUDIX family)